MRPLFIGVGVVVLALWYLVTVLPAGACTQQSDYPYGDANRNTDVDISDYARIKGIILQALPKDSAADANMDGDVDISDYGRVKGIILQAVTTHDRYIAVYDFDTAGAGSDDLAASKQVAALPAGRWVSAGETGWFNFTAPDYTAVEAIDASDFNMAANATGYNAIQCRFDVDETGNTSALTHLELNVTASSQNMSETLRYYAWNFSSGQWAQVGTDITMGDGEGSYYRVSDWGPPLVGDYIDASGYVFVMVIVPVHNRALDIDYIRLVLVEPYDDALCFPP